MSSDQKILLQKAILEIRDLKSRLNRVQKQYVEPIAVIGASCRFPGGANSLETFWELLQSGYSGISTVPAERWDADEYFHPDPDEPGKICTKLGGFLDVSAFDFDPHFFSISPREAESMDPQQRLLLELCWEAIEHANVVPESLFKSNTGVFMGVSSLDNATRIIGDAPSTDIDGYYGTGIALAPVAGRVSYLFGFTGPSFVVDTACSSSLLSLHLACESLRRRECDLALGGGVQLLTHPGVSVAFTKARMLSVDGRCKTFDADANGYVRGEGGGVFLLKRLSDAQRDNDTILSVIRGSGVNQDGASGGLTVPSGPSQESVIRTALSMSGLSPQDVSYVEAHGTGTPLGDPIEIGALNSVYGEARPKSNPLLVGSLKTNIGHLEAGAGIASAIKVMLSLQHKTIAPHLNFQTPNPMIPWNAVPIQVPSKAMDWKLTDETSVRSAGISSFGFSGTNVHLIMSEAPSEKSAESESTVSELKSTQLLVLSAKSKRSLQLLAKKHALALKSCPADTWSAYTHTAATMRSEFPYRISVSAQSPAEAASMLDTWAESGHHPSVSEAKAEDGSQPRVLMVFSGQGSQYAEMGKQLYNESESFRKDLELCDSLMKPILGYSILKCVFENEHDLNQTVNTQPALFALEISLARHWKQFGGKIDGVVGHSVGEYAAAVVSGVISLEDAAVLIAHRGKLMQSLPQGGGMLAVFTTLNELSEIVKESGLDVSVATSNSSRNQVLSGLKSELEKARNLLQTKGIESKELTVSHAFHSHLMDPILNDFRKIVEKVRFSKPEIPFFTNLTGKVAPDLVSTPEYWVRQIREAVLFHDAAVNALASGYSTVIEAGPKSTLINLVKRILTETEHIEDNLICESLLSNSKQDELQFQLALGAYWCTGGTVKWESLSQGRTNIPTYAFDRSFFKKEVALDVALGKKSGRISKSVDYDHPLINEVVESPLMDTVLFKSDYSVDEHDVLRDHKVFDRYVVAGAAHLSLVIGASQHFWKQDSVRLTDVMFPSALVLPGAESVSVHLSISRTETNNSFRLASMAEKSGEPVTHAMGATSKLDNHPGKSLWEQSLKEVTVPIEPSQIYETQLKRSIAVGQSYQWLQKAWLGTDVALAELKAPAEIGTHRFSIHPGMLDSCFGVLVMTAKMDVEETFIPFGVKSVTVFRSIGSETLRVIAQQRKVDAQNGILIGDITIENEKGEILAIFEGMEGRKASISALLKSIDSENSTLIYDRKWVNVSVQLGKNSPGRTLIVLTSDISETEISRLKTIPESEFISIHNLKSAQSVSDFGAVDVRSSKAVDSYWLGQKSLPKQVLFYENSSAPDVNTSIGSSSDEGITSCLIEKLTAVTTFIQGMIRNRVFVPLSTITLSGQDSAQDPLISYEASALTAVLKSTYREFPEYTGSQLVLDKSVSDTSAWFNNVSGMIQKNETIWIKHDSLFVARLQAHTPETEKVAPFDQLGSYLITGGSGALALYLVEYLLNKGAKHLILLSRTPNQDLKDSFLSLGASHDARLDVISGDVSGYASLQTAFETSNIDVASIKGVFHLAGATADIALNRLGAKQFKQSLRPKLQGIMNLTRLFDGQNLDFLFTFSSIASVFGNAGQHAYAGANAAMDGWSGALTGKDYLVKSIQWGPWGQQGMASKLDENAAGMMIKNGVHPLSNEQANRVMDIALSTDSNLFAVAGDFNWNTDFFDLGLTQSLRTPDEPSSTEILSFEDELNAIPSSGRKRYVNNLLNTLLVSALRLPEKHTIDPRERLFDLGVDSLIAIELKNLLQKKIGKQVSSTLLFDYPTLEKLTEHVLSLVEVNEVTSTETTETGDSNSIDVDINSMTDEDAELALLRALSGIQGGDDD
jgi:acyl transferase domain-containing protein/acyl carrier protein